MLCKEAVHLHGREVLRAPLDVRGGGGAIDPSWMANSLTRNVIQRGSCAVEGCGKPLRARGKCAEHCKAVCAVEACGKGVCSEGKGMCWEHRPPCEVPGCTELVRLLGKCYEHGRGLHSSTSQLNLSASYGIGGARRGCVARVTGVLGGVEGV